MNCFWFRITGNYPLGELRGFTLCREILQAKD